MPFTKLLIIFAAMALLFQQQNDIPQYDHVVPRCRFKRLA
jgi:hypothetical protein